MCMKRVVFSILCVGLLSSSVQSFCIIELGKRVWKESSPAKKAILVGSGAAVIYGGYNFSRYISNKAKATYPKLNIFLEKMGIPSGMEEEEKKEIMKAVDIYNSGELDPDQKFGVALLLGVQLKSHMERCEERSKYYGKRRGGLFLMGGGLAGLGALSWNVLRKKVREEEL